MRLRMYLSDWSAAEKGRDDAKGFCSPSLSSERKMSSWKSPFGRGEWVRGGVLSLGGNLDFPVFERLIGVLGIAREVVLEGEVWAGPLPSVAGEAGEGRGDVEIEGDNDLDGDLDDARREENGGEEEDNGTPARVNGLKLCVPRESWCGGVGEEDPPPLATPPRDEDGWGEIDLCVRAVTIDCAEVLLSWW
jgi:hypothetical protein